MIRAQSPNAVPGRLAGRRSAVAGRPPAARLAASALLGIVAAALAIAGLGRATAPRGDAGVSLAVGSSSAAVTVRNAGTTAFHGSLVVGTGPGAKTIAVDVGAGAAANVQLPARIACHGALDVRLEPASAADGATPEMLRLPCGSAAP